MQEAPCLICESGKFDIVYRLRRDPYLERLGLSGERVSKVMCRDCGLVYSHPRLEKEELKRLYQMFRTTETPTEEHLWWKKRMASEDFRWLAPRLGTGGSVLDIGCSEGSFLREFQQRGWRSFGIEPSSFARYGRMQYGLDIREALFEEVDLPKRSFNLVTALRVLEHIGDPRTFLERVETLLTEEGLVYLEVPNAWKPRHDLKEFLGAQHLRLFSKKTLLLFLARLGFEAVALDDSENGVRALFRRGLKNLPPTPPSPSQAGEARRLRRIWQGYGVRYFWAVTMKKTLREGADLLLGPFLARRSVTFTKRLFRIFN